MLVYILYVVFQLKSHSYLYASIPQQVIDEESHPGVLADLMNSSSDSSGNSSDETDDSAASKSTAKRIKRAVRHRIRKKSSFSSKETVSRQSVSKRTATADVHATDDGSTVPPVAGDGSNGDQDGHPNNGNGTDFNVVDFCDEAVYYGDDDTAHFNEPNPEESGPQLMTKSKRKGRDDKVDGGALVQSTRKSRFPRANGDRRQAIKDDESVAATRRKSPLRPALPAVLSNTVFTTPQVPGPVQHPSYGLRRSNSLPAHMSHTPLPMPPVRNAVQFARGAARMPAGADPETTEPPPLHPPADMSRTAAVVMLLVSTGLVAVCAEFLVDAIPAMISDSSVSQAFIGLIILPIVSNAAEHVTAVSVAAKNKMDLAIGVAVGSSIQIGMFDAQKKKKKKKNAVV